MSNPKVQWAEKIEAQLGSADDMGMGDVRCKRTRVEKAEGWSVVCEDGWRFLIDKSAMRFGLQISVEEPQVGDEIAVYLSGTTVVGVELRGQRLYLKSEREHELEWLLFRAVHHRQRLEEFAVERPNLDAEYERLPDVLKARIDRFREEDPDFRAQAESYEMAAVVDAPKIAQAVARWLPTYAAGPDGYPTDVSEEDARAVMKQFRELSYEEQSELVVDLNPGHSGNTFAAACMLAYRLLTGKEC